MLGVIGSLNWGCSLVEIPSVNQARGGPLAMISPASTPTLLTRPGWGTSEEELERRYPTGERNFVRIAATDHLQARALVEAAKGMGARRVAVLWDGQDTDTAGFAAAMRERAEALLSSPSLRPSERRRR